MDEVQGRESKIGDYVCRWENPSRLKKNKDTDQKDAEIRVQRKRFTDWRRK